MSESTRQNELHEQAVNSSTAGTDTRRRVTGIWLAIGSLLLAGGLVFHPPPSPDMAEFMATIAEDPTRWVAAHWASAFALSALAIAGLIALTAGDTFTRNWWTTTAWALLVVGALWVTTAAVAEATVMTAAAVTGDTATFEAWQLFAEAHAAAFIIVGAAIAVIAGNEARIAHTATPAWASWIGALAGVVAAGAFVLAVGVGIAVAGLVWLIATVVLSLWMLWYGVALARSSSDDSLSSEDLDSDRRKAVR